LMSAFAFTSIKALENWFAVKCSHYQTVKSIRWNSLWFPRECGTKWTNDWIFHERRRINCIEQSFAILSEIAIWSFSRFGVGSHCIALSECKSVDLRVWNFESLKRLWTTKHWILRMKIDLSIWFSALGQTIKICSI
jgi:hypothetical protein